MQLSILTSILQCRVRYAAQSRVLGQVQQQQINSVRYNNYTATSSLCVLCSGRGIVCSGKCEEEKHVILNTLTITMTNCLSTNNL